MDSRGCLDRGQGDWSITSCDTEQLCRELFARYSRILDPLCPPEERLQHQKVITEFSENNPVCVGCGLQLVQNSNPLASKLGLHLLEQFIRFRWNSLSQESQVELKGQLLVLGSNIGSGSSSPPSYVKEGIARCIVEVVKKVWPQLWPSFIQDLCAIGNQPSHMELVLLVYRRLMEDITSYDSQLSSHRKSDMLSEMKNEPSLTPLFHILVTVLESYSVDSFLGLVEAAVSTISSLVEWVDISYLTMDNGRLVVLLFNVVCSSSSPPSLQQLACDCLIDAFSRKGEIRSTSQYRQLFIQFLSKDVLTWIHTKTIAHQPSTGENDEEHYLLVKRLCQLLVQVGTCQLIPLVASEVLPLPDNFVDYLSLMLVFVQHPSQLICFNSLDLWSALTSSQAIKTSPVFLSVLPQLLPALRSKQLKVGDPELFNHPSCMYSRFDFNGSTEHGVFFSQFKGRVNNVLISAVSLVPVPASEQALALVQELVQKAYPPTEGGEGVRYSPVYLEWDAATSYLECWVAGLKQIEGLIKEVATIGVAVLDSVLSFSPADPTLVSCHVKMLEGALQTFVVYEEQILLQKYLEKILTCVVYPGEQVNKFALTREQKQVRLGSLYCLTNLVKGYTTSILPATEQLFEHYFKLVASDFLLFPEKCLFIEAFTTLSHFRSSEDQLTMMNKLMTEIVSLIENELKSVVSSLPGLVQYLGLDKDVSDPMFSGGDGSIAHLNRGKLCYCVHTIMGVLQKCTVRERRGCGAPNAGDVITSLLPEMFPLLIQFVFPLVKTFHLLWSEESRAYLSKYFQAIHSLSQCDREVILGTMGNSPTPQDELSRVQMQLITAYDQCVMAIGFAFPTFSMESLSEVGYVEAIVQNVFAHLSETKQLRLKPVIRYIMGPVVVMCPQSHWQTSLTPLLAHFCRIAFNCLQTNWSDIIKKRLSSHDGPLSAQDDEQQALSEEVLQYQFTIYLTKQYIQLIEIVCVKKQSSGKANGGSLVPVEEFVDTSSMETSNAREQATKGQQLSELATFLLRSEIQQLILLSILAPLVWPDTYTTRKCISIATIVFEKLSVSEFGEQQILQIMDQIFLALQTHGEDESIPLLLVTFALQIYESAVFSMPAVCHKISSLPGCSPERVEKFNQKLVSKMNDPNIKPGKFAKWKREEFKKLLSGIIGKPLGQLHKNTPVFFDLPSLVVRKGHRLKIKQESVEDISSLFGTTET